MEIRETSLQGLKIVAPRKFVDDRGVFWETWRQGMMSDDQGQPLVFVQDNLSVSAQGVLRGLHFQRPPHAQGKLVRAASGSIFDVVVDLRADSPTRGQWHGCELSVSNGLQLWVPSGFAHGFLALEDQSVVEYRCTTMYSPESEGSIRWDDPDIGIDWSQSGMEFPSSGPVLSGKDATAPLLSDIAMPF